MTKVCVIYDIGKTNKKLFVFNDEFEIVHQEEQQFDLSVDDDGDSCEDLQRLTSWIKSSFTNLESRDDIQIEAVNFSAYGASYVHLDKNKQPVTPLYNYTKSFPYKTRKSFEEKHGPLAKVLLETASPDLGMLNSANQLYWLKTEKPKVYKQIKYSLHLPQYCAFVLSGEINNEATSVGCHTLLWDFDNNDFHKWVKEENLHSAMLDPKPANTFKNINGINYGIGIHDSSAALIPYLKIAKEPFILLSTGTWSITFNPFCEEPLSEKSLKGDCLNFLRYDGNIVRASRLFSGNEHNRVVKHLAEHFGKEQDYFKKVQFDANIVKKLRMMTGQYRPENTELGTYIDCPFMERSLNTFENYEVAYHQFILDLIAQQIQSIKLTFGKVVPKTIFVDGGFSNNPIFMKLLSEAFFDKKVFASSLAKASGIGAALVVSEGWSPNSISAELLNLVEY